MRAITHRQLTYTTNLAKVRKEPTHTHTHTHIYVYVRLFVI